MEKIYLLSLPALSHWLMPVLSVGQQGRVLLPQGFAQALAVLRECASRSPAGSCTTFAEHWLCHHRMLETVLERVLVGSFSFSLT